MLALNPALARFLATMRRWMQGLPILSRRVIHRFFADRCMQRASALAYASLLAIIPLTSLGFAVFTSFEAFDRLAETVRDALLQHLLPTSQAVIRDYLVRIADKATALSVFGVVGLLVTASALITTMEEAFNDIWRIHQKRSWLAKFTAFWAILTLAPLLIGASISITSYFAALPLLRDVAAGAASLAGAPYVLPWLMSSLALTTMYMVLPNTRVPFRYAAAGGMAAGLLFELGKYGFAFYVTKLAHLERIYGALGTLPVFLIWLYLTWLVVLIGAEASYCLQHPAAEARRVSPGMRAFYWYFILWRAACRRREGGALTLADLAAETGLGDEQLACWLQQMQAAGLLRGVDNEQDGWLPAVDTDQLSLLEVHRALDTFALEIPPAWREHALARMLAGLYYRLERERTDLLAGISLRDLAAAEEEQA